MKIYCFKYLILENACAETAENTIIYYTAELYSIECVDLGMHKDNIQGSMSQTLLKIPYLENMVNLKFVGKYLSSEEDKEAQFWLTGRHALFFSI